MGMEDIIIKAARYAKIAHDATHKTRRNTGDPYFVHPARVAGMTAAYYRSTPIMVALAFTHDVIEDCPIPTVAFEREFGPELTRLVTYISKPKGMKWTREEMNAHYNGVLLGAPFEVKIVKMFDRIDNLRDMRGDSDEKKVSYSRETMKLAKSIGDADRSLESEMLGLAARLIESTVR